MKEHDFEGKAAESLKNESLRYPVLGKGPELVYADHDATKIHHWLDPDGVYA
jgi:hypothetical protein